MHALRLSRDQQTEQSEIDTPKKLTVFAEQVFEIVEIHMTAALRAFGNRNEEPDQKEDDDENDEGDGVFEGTPEPGPYRLCAGFRCSFVILLVPEICERHDDQAQDGIE